MQPTSEELAKRYQMTKTDMISNTSTTSTEQNLQSTPVTMSGQPQPTTAASSLDSSQQRQVLSFLPSTYITSSSTPSTRTQVMATTEPITKETTTTMMITKDQQELAIRPKQELLALCTTPTQQQAAKKSTSPSVRLNPIEPPVSLIGPSSSTRVFDLHALGSSLIPPTEQQQQIPTVAIGRPTSKTPPPPFTTPSSISTAQRSSSVSPTLPSYSGTSQASKKFPLPPYCQKAPSPSATASSRFLSSRMRRGLKSHTPAGISTRPGQASEMSISPIPYEEEEEKQLEIAEEEEEEEEMKQLELERQQRLRALPPHKRLRDETTIEEEEQGKKDYEGDELMGQEIPWHGRRSTSPPSFQPHQHRPQYLPPGIVPTSLTKLPSPQSTFAPSLRFSPSQQLTEYGGGAAKPLSTAATYPQQQAQAPLPSTYPISRTSPYFGPTQRTPSSEETETSSSLSDTSGSSLVYDEEEEERQVTQQQAPLSLLASATATQPYHPYQRDYRDVGTGRGTSSSSRHLPLKLQQKSGKASLSPPPYFKKSHTPTSTTPTSSYTSSDDEEHAPTVVAEQRATSAPSSKQGKFNQGAWTTYEHEQFLRGLEACGHQWKKIAVQFVQTRSRRQVASHAQKYLEREKRRSQMSKKDSRSTNRPTLII